MPDGHLRQVGQPQDEVRIRCPSPGTTHTFLLDRIVRLTNACGVDHRHGITVEIELNLDDVARGASMRRHDRDLAPRQLIHQRRLADIRRTGNRNHQAVAQPFALPLRRKHFFDFLKQRSDLRKCRRHQFQGHIALVGKIDAGFDQSRSLNDPRAPVARFVAEQAFQLPQCLAALPIGVGVNEVVEAFGFGQIQLAVLKCTAGKFARLRRPHIFESGERREQRSEHRAPTVDVQLSDVLTGRTGRTRKPEHDRIVDRPLADIAKQRPGSGSGKRDFADQRGQHLPCL